jgi:hypothetical protein
MMRQGEHRFVPLLLSHVYDILPRLSNPMLQNAPENTCSVDIFDGFGNAGMAQPCLPLEEYDNKYARMDDFKTESSPVGTGMAPGSDLSSPYSNPGTLMGQGLEYQQPLPTDFSISEVAMGQMMQGSAMGTQHGQHHQQAFMNGLQGMNPAMVGLDSVQGMHHQLMAAHTLPSSLGAMGQNPGMLRQQPQRSNSYTVPPQSIRTIADFHAIQSGNSPSINGLPLKSMSADLDFNTVR